LSPFFFGVPAIVAGWIVALTHHSPVSNSAFLNFSTLQFLHRRAAAPSSSKPVADSAWISMAIFTFTPGRAW
jgi:hypothetical protein